MILLEKKCFYYIWEDIMGEFRIIILVVIVIILAAILIYTVMMSSNKKQYFSKIDELDYKKHEISNKTVPFELAKLKSTKKSERIVSLVSQWEKRWGRLEGEFVMITEKIIYAEELVEKRDFDEAQSQLDAVTQQLTDVDQEVEQLLEEIRSLKRSEERSRSNVVGLKEQFEQKKKEYEEKQVDFLHLQTEIKQLFVEIEQLFLCFNECMEECNYDEADETITEIKASLNVLSLVFERVLLYEETVRKNLAPLVKEVLKSYQTLSQSGVYLEHLEIEETVADYQLQLSDFNARLKTFDFTAIEAFLLDIDTNAKQMISLMKQELELKETLQKKVYATEEKLEKVKRVAQHLDKRYENIKSNYTLLEEEEAHFSFVLNEIQILQNEMMYCMTRFKEKQTPSSVLHQELETLMTQLSEVETQLEMFEQDIEQLYAGEKKCRREALHLLTTLNDAKAMHALARYTVYPNKINQQLLESTHQMMSLLEALDQVPVNMIDIEQRLESVNKLVNATSETVQKEVQHLKLAESLIVYGHRYIAREGMYVVDLTIAEDQFKQGNYTTVIESMKRILTSVEGHAFNLRYQELKQTLDCYLI